MRRRLRITQAGLLGLAVADLVAQRREWLPLHPGLLAALVGLLLLLLVVDAGWLVAELTRRRVPLLRGAAGLTWRAGLLLALGAGTAHWLLSLQGFVVLSEGDAVPVGSTAHLQEFDAGPLARPEDFNVLLQLERVELAPRGPFSYQPRTWLLVTRGHAPPERVSVEPGQPAFLGPLRLQQGAFGFSPRIVLTKDGETVFDQVVPFTTTQEGGGALSFGGDFTVEKHRLRVTGTVDLEDLDQEMKGHATLALAVTQDAEPLGRGELKLGHFAELEKGYRVGFAGLKRWAEIDLSRRMSQVPMRAGGVLLLLGALASAGLALFARRGR